MRSIAHLSNLMVGWTAPAVLVALADTLHRLQPNLVCVSGNLTASGQASELRAARTLLNTLPSPQVVVPGDGDSVGHSRFSRLLSSSGTFSTLVEANATPCFADSEIVVVGVDSSKAAQIKHGGLDEKNRKHIDGLLQAADSHALRVMVSFRPSYGQQEDPSHAAFDLVLTGPLDPMEPLQPGHPTLVVSTGDRLEGLSFNILRVAPPLITVERYGWKIDNAEFRLLSSEPLTLPTGASGSRFTA